jgi:hypothetical protein
MHLRLPPAPSLAGTWPMSIPGCPGVPERRPCHIGVGFPPSGPRVVRICVYIRSPPVCWSCQSHGTSSLRSSAPAAGAESPFNVMRSLSPTIDRHLPPPYSNCRGCQCLTHVGREGRAQLRASDRLMWVWLSKLWPGWRQALVLIQPETVLCWHRQGSHDIGNRRRRAGGPSFGIIFGRQLLQATSGRTRPP